MPLKKPKYYAYFIPPNGSTGVTNDWKKTEKLVIGKTGARFKAFDNKKDAELWLAHGARYEAKPAQYKKLQAGIYFDAGTGRGEGVEISVTDEKGTNLLHKAIPRSELNTFGKHLIGSESATNNYGEPSLRFAMGIEIAKKITR